MDFILYGRGGDELVEGVTQLKYLGRPLDQYDNTWPEIHWNIRRAWKVWGRLGKILRQGGGGGQIPMYRKFSLGSGASSYVFWMGIVGHLGGDEKDGGGNPYKILKTDQVK